MDEHGGKPTMAGLVPFFGKRWRRQLLCATEFMGLMSKVQQPKEGLKVCD
jgi:hypothetical protein